MKYHFSYINLWKYLMYICCFSTWSSRLLPSNLLNKLPKLCGKQFRHCCNLGFLRLLLPGWRVTEHISVRCEISPQNELLLWTMKSLQLPLPQSHHHYPCETFSQSRDCLFKLCWMRSSCATSLLILLTIIIITTCMHLSLNLGTACSSWAHVEEFEVIIFQLEAVIAVKLVGHGIAA